ncbi:MAG: Na+/H+-dicarboxylate symporter [Polyangiales bacterium]|jgi:Na+/H+-dicarboxylate symporter
MHPIEQLHLEPLRRLTRSLEQLIAGRLWLKVIIGLILGVGAGMALGPEAGWLSPSVAQMAVRWIALPGALFLALVQMIVVPLVFASIVRGLAAGESMAQLRRMGTRAAAYFVVSSTVSILIGLGLALLVRPGRFVDASRLTALAESPSVGDVVTTQSQGVPETIIGLLPVNPLASMVSGEMLQVVLFALIMGVALVGLPHEKSAPLFDLLGSLQEVCMTVVRWAMRLAPIAVFGLMTQLTSQLGVDVLLGMAGYVGTVLGGLAILLVIYVFLAAVIGRRNPRAFLKALRELQLLAFSTSSSAAVMPLSMQTAEKKLGVRPAVAEFLIPLGATINMDGTALYQGVATVFLAQVFDVQLDAAGLGLVVVTSVAASIGSPATPGVGVIVLATVLQTVGIPPGGIALLIGVDRILDMCRTAVNVTGDMTAAVILDRWLGESPTEIAVQTEASPAPT